MKRCARSHYTAHVLSMAAPWPLARAELWNATTPRVDHLSCLRVRTLIPVIGHAIVVLVPGRRRSGFEATDQETGRLDHGALSGEPRAINIKMSRRTVHLRRRSARILPDRESMLTIKSECG